MSQLFQDAVYGLGWAAAASHLINHTAGGVLDFQPIQLYTLADMAQQSYDPATAAGSLGSVRYLMSVSDSQEYDTPININASVTDCLFSRTERLRLGVVLSSFLQFAALTILASVVPAIKAACIATYHVPVVPPLEETKRFNALVLRACQYYPNVEPELVFALFWQESKYDSSAESCKGARGLGQLMPDTAKRLGVNDPNDAEQNVSASVRLLSRLLNRFHGNTILALAAYNAGEAAVIRAGMAVPRFLETQNYVKSIYYRYYPFAKIIRDTYISSDTPESLPDVQHIVATTASTLTKVSLVKARRSNQTCVISSESDIRIPVGRPLTATFPGPIEFVAELLMPPSRGSRLAINEDQGEGGHRPSDVTITYYFSNPTLISGIEMVPHTNSITAIEVCHGDEYGDVTDSCEQAKSDFGDKLSERDGTGFAEYGHYRFALKHATRFSSLIIRPKKTFLECGGWGIYSLWPVGSSGRPILPK